jgi:hypothetical protein
MLLTMPFLPQSIALTLSKSIKSTLGRADETVGLVDAILNALFRAKGPTVEEPQIEFESALSLEVGRIVYTCPRQVTGHVYGLSI